MSARPILIVFCREPIAGQVKTRLASRIGEREAAALADAFIRDTLAKAHAVAPGRILIAGSAPEGAPSSSYFRRISRRYGAAIIDQGPGSLGARMARSLQAGATSHAALLLGTDVPSLPLRILRGLMALLGRAPVVVAPSLDGGYYAIGVRGAMPPVFSGMRWGRTTVYRDTIARLRRAGFDCRSGPAWYDVDRWEDLLLLAAHLRILRRAKAEDPCPATTRVLRRLGLPVA